MSDPEAEANFAVGLAEHTALITIPNTADCGDGERRTIRLANGVSDQTILRERVVSQLFGGLGLATTKALVAANAVIIRDAKSMWDAYEKTSTILAELRQEMHQEDGGHENCGASLSVRKISR